MDRLHQPKLGAPWSSTQYWAGYADSVDMYFGDGADNVPLRFVSGARQRVNVVAICINAFAPWMLFSSIFSMFSFSFHHKHPETTWCIVLVVALLILYVWSFTFAKPNRYQVTWYCFAAGSLSVALLTGIAFGTWNYKSHMQFYYDSGNLNSYGSVNPQTNPGQQFMDAGRVSFADGTRLDLSKAMSFKNNDLYCVVPITNGKHKLESYDYWAVGINCCSSADNSFHCGEFNNPFARSGLRQMDAEERPFFRLAVQEAEATFHIQAKHPLFFTWMQDPLKEIDIQGNKGFKYFLFAIFTYFFIHIFCVAVAAMGFSRIGHMTTGFGCIRT